MNLNTNNQRKTGGKRVFLIVVLALTALLASVKAVVPAREALNDAPEIMAYTAAPTPTATKGTKNEITKPVTLATPGPLGGVVFTGGILKGTITVPRITDTRLKDLACADLRIHFVNDFKGSGKTPGGGVDPTQFEEMAKTNAKGDIRTGRCSYSMTIPPGKSGKYIVFVFQDKFAVCAQVSLSFVGPNAASFGALSNERLSFRTVETKIRDFIIRAISCDTIH